MKTFKEQAQECTELAGKSRKRFMRLCYIAVSAAIANLALGTYLAYAGRTGLAVMQFGWVLVFAFLAFKARRDAWQQFDKFMKLRNEALDLDDEYYG